MIDALVKYRGTGGGDRDRNLGTWTFTELPRAGDSLMLLDAPGLFSGYTGWKVTEVYHIPRRAEVEYPSVCVFVDYGANAPVMNLPPAPHMGCGPRKEEPK